MDSPEWRAGACVLCLVSQVYNLLPAALSGILSLLKNLSLIVQASVHVVWPIELQGRPDDYSVTCCWGLEEETEIGTRDA